MDSPSSTTRRQAWVQNRRQWLTLEEQELQEPVKYIQPSTLQHPEHTHPSAPQGPTGTHLSGPQQSVSEDDVFSEGCSAGKIKSWLLGCGLERGSENSSHSLTFESLLKASSYEDDLSLGAEATALNIEGISELGSSEPLLPPPKHTGVTTSTPRQRRTPPLLDLGHSMTSSALSYSTSKASSVSEVLQLCAEDAEETLCQLGFGLDEPAVTARIPTRFLNFPSQLNGINFRLFLQSQLNRLRQEDPGLSLASRFRQVEVLTAMANAFYSLYSHVSRTPLQKLAPPEFSYSPTGDRQTGWRFMGSVRSEPKSPVERLKDTVSKMCLYTGSGGSTRVGSDSAFPGSGVYPGPKYGSHSKKRSSLPDLVGLVLEKTKIDAVSRDVECPDIGVNNGTSATMDRSTMAKDRDKEIQGHLDTAVDKDRKQNCSLSERQDTDTGKGTANRAMDTYRTPSPRLSSQSGQSEPASRKKLDFCLTSPRPASEVKGGKSTIRPTGWVAAMPPVAKVTHDIICPQIVESVHQILYRSQQQQRNTNVAIQLPGPSSENVRQSNQLDGPHGPSEEERLAASKSAMHIEMAVTPKAESEGDLSLGGTGKLVESTSMLVDLPSGRMSPCLITVTDVTCSFGSDTHEAVLTSSGDTTANPTGSRYSPEGCRNKSYLSLRVQAKASDSLQQANSFELEELHSAGEEEFGQQETVMSTSLLMSSVSQNKGLVVRGDSMQSDSSGYADEDISSVHSPGRDKS
ncbi:protein ITPRID2 isoform X2 [Esox lucius]|uniref:protein ITPRID2 isoform X2 n=1 Tax=Esox lucius TaxID=8010 RepID=UPI001476F7D7|nr:protein ITPRID2 isoform X2 [Esox lucius]